MSKIYSYQFDPLLGESGRVQVTAGGVAVAEVQTQRTATTLTRMLNEHAALVAVAEAARNLTADNGGRALAAALWELDKQLSEK